MIIEKAIIHVLDTDAEEPVLSDEELYIDAEVENFYTKCIKKIVKSSNLFKCKFNNYKENKVHKLTSEMLYDSGCFIENSKEISKMLYSMINTFSVYNSSDVAFVKFILKDVSYIAILKMEYKKLFNHSIKYDKDRSDLKIDMIANTICIQESPKIINAAIIGPNGVNDEYHFKAMDLLFEDSSYESPFLKDFLDAYPVKDETVLTKKFATITKNWIENSYYDDLKKGEDLKSLLNYTLNEDCTVDVEKFAQKYIDENKRKEYVNLMKDREIDESFYIDKTWVEKKLKKRSFTTNTGINVKADMETIEDPSKFSIKDNKDGTYTIEIKNIEFIEEK